MKLVQVVQPAVALLQEGMQFLVVEVGNDELPKDVQDATEQGKQEGQQDESNRMSMQRTDSFTRLETAALLKVHEKSAHQLAASSSVLPPPAAPAASTSSAPENEPSTVLSEAVLVRAAKQNLRLAVSVLDPVCGPTNLPLNDLLLLQCGRNLSFDAHIMEAHVSETIRCLNALPQHYRDDNYRLIMAEMFEDHAAHQRTQEVCFHHLLYVVIGLTDVNRSESKDSFFTSIPPRDTSRSCKPKKE